MKALLAWLRKLLGWFPKPKPPAPQPVPKPVDADVEVSMGGWIREAMRRLIRVVVRDQCEGCRHARRKPGTGISDACRKCVDGSEWVCGECHTEAVA
jgi:hypothetical protein